MTKGVLPTKRQAWTPEKERVYRAAMALCAESGFCYRDDMKISNARIAKRLEAACDKARAAARKKGAKHG